MSAVNSMTLNVGGAVVTPPFAKHLVTGFAPTPLGRLKILLLGHPKTGKSNFAGQADHNLIVDFANETRGIVAPLRSTSLDLPSWARSNKQSLYDAIEGVVAWLVENGPEKTGIQRVTFDTGGKLYQAICAQVVAEYNKERQNRIDKGEVRAARSIGEVGAEGAGYYQAAMRVAACLDLLARSGYGWTFICHKKMERVAGTDEFRSVVALPASMQTPLFEDAELTVEVVRNISLVTPTVQQRLTLPTGKEVVRDVAGDPVSQIAVTLEITPTYSADPKGSRYANLPRALPIPLIGGWQAFEKAYAEANAKTAAQASKETKP